jgi:hypothetical protein
LVESREQNYLSRNIIERGGTIHYDVDDDDNDNDVDDNGDDDSDDNNGDNDVDDNDGEDDDYDDGSKEIILTW